MGRKKDEKGKDGKKKNRLAPKRRVCRFCVDKKLTIDFKDARALGPFITERGRIVPRRISGNCSHHQRQVTVAVKYARIMAFIPFSATQVTLS